MFKKALSLLLSMMLVVTSLVATVVSVLLPAIRISYPVLKNSQVTSGLRLKQLAEIM